MFPQPLILLSLASTKLGFMKPFISDMQPRDVLLTDDEPRLVSDGNAGNKNAISTKLAHPHLKHPPMTGYSYQPYQTERIYEHKR